MTPANFKLQSSLNHIGIVMDGNRRWARERGLPDAAGHRAGLERLVDLLPNLAAASVDTLTVYAFSSNNWRRSTREVTQLFALFVEGFRRFAPLCREHNLRVEVIGRRDRLPAEVMAVVSRITHATASGGRTLRVALDYSARESLLRAAAEGGSTTEVEFSELLNQSQHSRGPYRELDLLIRTGKEQRLSDFMLWECAYAELCFPDLYWPDFDRGELRRVLAQFAGRSRRFGK